MSATDKHFGVVLYDIGPRLDCDVTVPLQLTGVVDLLLVSVEVELEGEPLLALVALERLLAAMQCLLSKLFNLFSSSLKKPSKLVCFPQSSLVLEKFAMDK
jgi:hypothetical protein